MATKARKLLMFNDDEASSAWTASVPGMPVDTAYAFQRAVRELFGEPFPIVEAEKDFAGNVRKVRPASVTVDFPGGERLGVLWGRMGAPKYPFPFTSDVGTEHGRIVFKIHSQFRTEEQRGQLNQLLDRTRELLRTSSIVRSRAMRLLPINSSLVHPEFIDVSGYSEDQLIFPEATQNLLSQVLFFPLRHAEACRQRGVNLKRGLLLGGKWGTGKTLTARVAASVGTAHGWTFFYVAAPSMLPTTLQIATSYQPALIFVEDIDECLEDRNQLANYILNTLDGLTSKDNEIMVVLTTNFIDRVDPALLRPGRMDTSIEMPLPDRETVGRLITHYGPDIEGRVFLGSVMDALAGQIPAVIREVVERARLISLTGGNEVIKERHLLAAAESMADHMRRLNADPTKNDSLELRLGRTLKDIVIAGYRES